MKPRYIKPESVKALERLADENERNKYPDLPYRIAAYYRDDTANGLTKCVIDWIKLNGWQAERINTMGRPIDNRQQVTDVLGRTRTIGGITWVQSTSTTGSADISATINGRSVKIEVKTGKDRQSEAQKKYQEDIEKAGGIYIIVKCFDDFMDWWNRKECWL